MMNAAGRAISCGERCGEDSEGLSIERYDVCAVSDIGLRLRVHRR